MPTFKIDVAMDVRAYGYVEIEAENIDKAVDLATPDFIAENFDLRGSPHDYIDYSSPRDIWLADFECEETGEEGAIEIDLPNSHYPGGLAHDAAPDMLAALKECLPLFDMVTALDDHGSNALGQAENLIRAAIAKAEGAA